MEDSGEDVSLEDLLRYHHHSIVADIHTLMPGKIVTYYPATQTADVQPMVKRPYWSDTDTPDGVTPGNKAYISYPLIPNVPVEFPGAGGYILTFPVNAGDTCDIEFSEASLAEYLSTGQESEPVDVGRHKLAYAVCHPVFCPITPTADGAITGNDRVVLGTPGGVQIQITGANIILGAGASDFVALASKVDTAIKAWAQWAASGTGTGYVPPIPATQPNGGVVDVAAAVTKAK